LGIVPEVPDDAITSPEYQVWRLKSGFLPAFMALLIRTDYFLSLVAFNRVGGVKQRMYYANLAEIRLPMVPLEVQQRIADEYTAIQAEILMAKADLERRKADIEKMILGTMKIEGA
jgi:restriction endonuclease S subunit